MVFLKAKKYLFLLLFACCMIFIGKQLFQTSRQVDHIPASHHAQKYDGKQNILHQKPGHLNNAIELDQKIILLFWSMIWGQPASEAVWKKGNKHGECPVYCEVAVDRSRVPEAHAFIVHAPSPYPLPPNKRIPWILFSQENPMNAPVLSNPTFMSQFHLLTSYRLDSDFPSPVVPKPSLEPPLPFQNKSGGIMVAFTNCEPVRTEYLRQLMRVIEVDSYGGCLHNKDGLVARYGEDFREVKTQLQRNYKFVLVFFNQDCDYFVDEQILHAMNAGAVPVVMSTDKIYEFLPGNLRNAIINVRHFESAKDLADRLRFLMNNETEYNKYLEWKEKGLGNIGDTVIGKYWERKFGHWCDMCVAISRGRWHKEGLKADYCEQRRYETWKIEPNA